MKKTIKLIDLDCGHCADKIQNAVQKIDGVTSVTVNFLGQKMCWRPRTRSLTACWPRPRHSSRRSSRM